MKIPEIRDRLQAIADELSGQSQARMLDDIAADIRVIIRQLHRRPAVCRGHKISLPITAERKAAIVADWEANPNQTFALIAQRHGVNPGRVSEAVRGKRP